MSLMHYTEGWKEEKTRLFDKKLVFQWIYLGKKKFSVPATARVLHTPDLE